MGFTVTRTSRARSRRSSRRSTPTGRSTSTVGPAPHRLAARARDARDLRRRLDRRADVADRRRAHRGHARGGRGDRRARAVPPRHRHRAAGRDVRAARRGAAPRRRRRARRRRRTTARPTQQGLFEWYSRVATEFPDLPIIVYNVPIRAAVDIAPATVGKLRRAHENIVGIKETTKRLRARLLRPGPVRHRLHRALGHRAAVLPDARRSAASGT